MPDPDSVLEEYLWGENRLTCDEGEDHRQNDQDANHAHHDLLGADGLLLAFG